MLHICAVTFPILPLLFVSPTSEASREQLHGHERQAGTLTESREGASHSLSMRSAEIALKMTSCRVMIVLCRTALQPRHDVEFITLLLCAGLYFLWVTRSLHAADLYKPDNYANKEARGTHPSTISLCSVCLR